MSNYVIDKDVPIPKKGFRSTRYPWHDLKAGYSFLMIPNPIEENGKAKAASICSITNKRTGKKFVWRVTEEGIRVWRVKQEGETE